MMQSRINWCPIVLLLPVLFGWVTPCSAQESASLLKVAKPKELSVLKASVGVWDASVEVWPQGPDADSLKFKGVETNHAFGEYWISSDFVSEYLGQTMKVHSIIGYDLDKKSLVGKTVDYGPYAADMSGTYDEATNSVLWKTHAKTPDGKSMIQETTITQKDANTRVLILNSPGDEDGEFVKFMQITFVKRS